MRVMYKWYTPPKVTNGDLRVPVTFYKSISDDGPYPTVSTKAVFTTLCELYDSSLKDIEKIDTTNSKHIVSLNFRHPHEDYNIEHSDKFKILEGLYSDIEFDVEHFSTKSDDKEMLKVVGVSYAN